MKETRVARRYAKSLISLAEEREMLDQVKKDVLIIKSVCEENYDFSNLLKSPIVSSDKKNTILNKIFSEKISGLSLTFINLITEKKRESILHSITDNFIDFYNQSKNIKPSIIITPNKITEEMREKILIQIKSILGNSSIEFKEYIDESLLGGFILRIGDLEFNASISNKLKLLKRNFVSNAYIKEF